MEDLPREPSDHLVQLDALRVLALVAVVGLHLPVCPEETSVVLNRVTSVWNRGGWIGVDVFFVLSGFLVSGLLFREYQRTGALNLKLFLLRRGFKIYPPFWFLLATMMCVPAIRHGDVDRSAFLGELFFLQNYADHVWGHTWSIAVEEHFYLFLCLLFYFLARRKEARFDALPRVFVVVGVACLAMRMFTAGYLQRDYEHIIEPTHLRIDSMLSGVLISYFWHFRGLKNHPFVRTHRLMVGTCGLLLLVPAFVFALDTHVWIGVVGFYAGAALLLMASLEMNCSRSRTILALAALARYSYSIYLWNIPARRIAYRTTLAVRGDFDWWLFAPLYWVVTFLLGISMAMLIERPALRLRDRYFPSATHLHERGIAAVLPRGNRGAAACREN